MRPTSERSTPVDGGIPSILEGIDLDAFAIRERVPIVAMALLYTSGLDGLRLVRTAEIARLAHTTESTMFRHFPDGIDSIVEISIEWCWEVLNLTVGNSEFDCPIFGSATTRILNDCQAILGMYSDPVTRLAATGAFLSFRRAPRFFREGTAHGQERYFRRLAALCRASIRSDEVGDSRAEHLATFVANYLASVWFTWLSHDDSVVADPEYLLGIAYVLSGLQQTLDQSGSIRIDG